MITADLTYEALLDRISTTARNFRIPRAYAILPQSLNLDETLTKQIKRLFGGKGFVRNARVGAAGELFVSMETSSKLHTDLLGLRDPPALGASQFQQGE